MTSSSLIGVLVASSSAMSLDTNTSPVRPVNRHRNLHSERGAHDPPVASRYQGAEPGLAAIR